jgi:hypothetical protein
MQTVLAYARMLAPIVSSVATALTPTYGKFAWFVAVVAGASAIGLISPTILPPRQPKTPGV